MLVVPFTFDQPDNALRVNRLGFARTLSWQKYSVARAARQLRILLENPEYSRRAEEAGRIVRTENGQALACNAVKQMLDS